MILDDGWASRRIVVLVTVTLLHLLILAVLASNAEIRRSLFVPSAARLIIERRTPPPEPPSIAVPRLAPPPDFVPTPDIEVAAPAARIAPLKPAPHAPPVGRPSSPFGAATDAGLGLDVGTTAGGGAGDRGSLAQFEAAVRRQVLAGKRQPALAWDRRNTCVVGYTVHIGAGGTLSGFSIDPCSVPEINEAARLAVQQAAYPRPPHLGAMSYEVHGSLVFRP